MDCCGSSEHEVLRGPLTRKPSRPTQPESSSSKSAGAKFSRNWYRSSTRQSHSARSRDQCPRQCRRGSLEVIVGSFTEGQEVCPCSSNWERLDACTQFLERARKRLARADAELLKLQTERAQLATELAEGQARFEALRRSEAPISRVDVMVFRQA